MYPDQEPPSGISASMTVGELVRLVDPRDHAQRSTVPVWVETTDRDPDLDAEIMEGVRARRLPFACMAWTGAVGLLAHLVGTPTVWVVGGAVLVLLVLRLRYGRRIPDGWSRRWWVFGVAAVVWVVVTAALGPSWGGDVPITGPAVLVVVGAALSARWWAEWEVPHPGHVDDPEPVHERPALDSSRAARVERAWAAASSAGRGAVPRGALLTGRVDLPDGGLRYVVQLDPDAGVGATAFCARDADVALILRMSSNEVVLEVGESEDVAILSLVPQAEARLAEGVPYSGPTYLEGRVPIAVDVTGRERDWVAYERNQGVSSGLAVGDMRSGKTTALELVALGLRASGVWRVWYGDGDSAGASSNLLMDGGVSHWPERSPDGLLRQLAAFEEVLESRAHQKNLLMEDPVTGLPVPRQPGQPPINEFPPCEDFPGYYWFIPELFQAVQNEQLRAADFSGRLDKLLRRAPKFGLGIAADTQSALGSDFGSSTQLRSWLSRVNAFVFRTTNRSDQYAINGLTLSPGALRKGGGYGFAAGQDGAGIMLRTMWQPDLHRWVPGLPLCDDDPEAAGAIAPFLPEQIDDPELTLEQYRTELDAWRTKATPAATSEAPPPTLVTVGGVSVPAPLGGTVTPIRPDVAQAAPSGPRPVRPLSALGPVPANAVRILDELHRRGGWQRTADLAEWTGLSPSAVSKGLGVLEERGLVRRQHGVAEAV